MCIKYCNINYISLLIIYALLSSKSLRHSKEAFGLTRGLIFSLLYLPIFLFPNAILACLILSWCISHPSGLWITQLSICCHKELLKLILQGGKKYKSAFVVSFYVTYFRLFSILISDGPWCRSEVVSVLIRPSNQLKITFLEVCAMNCVVYLLLFFTWVQSHQCSFLLLLFICGKNNGYGVYQHFAKVFKKKNILLRITICIFSTLLHKRRLFEMKLKELGFVWKE